MKIVLLVALVICLGGAGFSTASAAEIESDSDGGFIVDTSLPFTPGAREHFIPVRLPFGLPSFQQGFVDGMHYRIDPDGGALFSSDARLRNDVFEVECKGVVTTCIARRGIIELSINRDGAVSLSLDTVFSDEEIYLGYGEFSAEKNRDSWKLLKISVDMLSVDYLADYSELAVAKDGTLLSQVSLEGILVIEAYLKWVLRRQAPRDLPASWSDAHANERVERTKLVDPVFLTKTTKVIEKDERNWTLYSPELQFSVVAADALSEPENLSDTNINITRRPNIGGEICRPAILADVNENSIIEKSISQVKLQSKAQLPKKFSDPAEALKGLPGVYVFTDYLAEPVHLKGKFNGKVHDAIEERLKAGGVRVLSKSELENVPGQPRMEVYFSKANAATGCSFAVWVSVRQSMLLGRDEKVRLLSGTWGSGGAHLREYSSAPEFNTIMNHVDRFIAAYKKANS